MLRLTQLKLNLDFTYEQLVQSVCKKLRIKPNALKAVKLAKKSLDARDKNNIHFSCIVDLEVNDEKNVLKQNRGNKNLSLYEPSVYTLPQAGKNSLEHRPCVVGSGPAGLFCAYMLALNGLRPILIERGQCVEQRTETVKAFWDGKKELDSESNIQFGEGGAGTFSDGKLNTGVKDPSGRNRLVLETFVKFGAKEDILTAAKPHVGTDYLCKVVSGMRNSIIENGGDVLFETKLNDLVIENDRLKAIKVISVDTEQVIECDALVLAIGHSARDTFELIKTSGFNIEAKAFAVGVRAEHLQEEINRSQYGKDYRQKYKDLLPAADYKLTTHTKNGRSVYSFCMCPGGFVVNSSSEEGKLCVNGMSYSGRNGLNSNAAIVVNVTPEDTGGNLDPMAGVEFQRKLEKAAFEAGDGSIPVQRLEDFNNKKVTEKFGKVVPQQKGGSAFADINKIVPEFISESIKEAFGNFEKSIEGYSDGDTILSAVESRTSSPIRIVRDEHFESNIKGVFPCGEGAGYAGGITSAAMDGIKVFEEIYRRYGKG